VRLVLPLILFCASGIVVGTGVVWGLNGQFFRMFSPRGIERGFVHAFRVVSSAGFLRNQPARLSSRAVLSLDGSDFRCEPVEMVAGTKGT
jgi:hypothetical protein